MSPRDELVAARYLSAASLDSRRVSSQYFRRRNQVEGLEMALDGMKRQCQESFEELRTVVVGETARLGAKLGKMDREVASLQRIVAALRSSMLGESLEARRKLEGQIKNCKAAGVELHAAVQEASRHQSILEDLGQRLLAKEQETCRLRAAVRVILAFSHGDGIFN